MEELQKQLINYLLDIEAAEGEEIIVRGIKIEREIRFELKTILETKKIKYVEEKKEG